MSILAAVLHRPFLVVFFWICSCFDVPLKLLMAGILESIWTFSQRQREGHSIFSWSRRSPFYSVLSTNGMRDGFLKKKQKPAVCSPCASALGSSAPSAFCLALHSHGMYFLSCFALFWTDLRQPVQFLVVWLHFFFFFFFFNLPG